LGTISKRFPEKNIQKLKIENIIQLPKTGENFDDLGNFRKI